MMRSLAGPVFCRREGAYKPREAFKIRNNGHPYSWCAECKRAHDRAKRTEWRARRKEIK